MKIVGMSDLHGLLPKLEDIPDCNVVIIAGDISPLYLQEKIAECAIWFGNVFIPWCETLPCDKVIIIGGNHDFFLEDIKPHFLKFGKNKKIILLKHQVYKYNHITFFGTPYVEGLPRWAFNLSLEQAEEKFSKIPNCDVLISHTPPFDAANTGRVGGYRGAVDYGSWALRNAILNKRIGLIICGHIHTGDHSLNDWFGHKIVNVSLLNEDYNMEFSPKLIEI